ncbi:2-polyprenyl-6-methoxyphenol hydroxylase [Streptoalloteichus tenebrarius]|uniref:2-polyprenyl-6-methoxyphenol hydroxylase n=1 Tax=Streptoalloteichus tenebrarius (strain ATCC 17920 / DSM 40477 / JCM 4838 / CBS 697.72 / NBRC 16177 / NCIMB 11028 / NRRL B-12390 / A12253. 1 / ISP 5477) TaxID=1933 RepID=A0ABT1HYK1_STRSD|nr:FAD-dependent oxidoreductase [Streptoalloteichus tenebrarius]MCP2260607.1 2-polyprenyl-6-methoxyphenol hydroxylase [Streptoalloteichus tenebrarius]BFF01490.1 FAD-dependent monooxygenase [Streptoalloteichus tenebrarius]
MDVDVVVVGAGPTGLMLAGELVLGGASVVVLERRAEPDQTIRAGAIGPLAAEALVRRGLGPEVAEVERATTRKFLEVRRAADPALDAALRTAEAEGRLDEVLDEHNPFRRGGGHFAGLFLIDQTRQEDPARRYAAVSQQDLERILAGHVDRLGVEVRRERTVTGFTDHGEDGITVVAATPDGEEERFHARYLVGCDGGRSTVRKLAGFDFPGTPPSLTGHQALVELDDPDKLLPLGWRRTPTGMMAYGPVPGRVFTLEFDGPPENRDAPVTREEIQESLRRVSGTDVTVTAVRTATRFTDNARQVTTYRLGRVLLAGDAAHVHSPFGGQGINLGLLDAVNLGWKLAAVVRGRVPEGLLDTYTAERHPVGARVLQNTRAQVAIMRPDDQSGAMRELVAEMLGLDEVNRFVGSMLHGVAVRYDFPYPTHGHPLIGRSCPELELEVDVDSRAATRLSAVMSDGRAVLLDLGAGVADAADGWRDRVRVVTGRCLDRDDLAAVLLRPDGHVAWAVAQGERPDRKILDVALRTWFGEPAGDTHAAADEV